MAADAGVTAAASTDAAELIYWFLESYRGACAVDARFYHVIYGATSNTVNHCKLLITLALSRWQKVLSSGSHGRESNAI